MPDWTKSMKQTFDYYTVDPGTWQNVAKLDTVTSASLTFSSSSETIATASISTTDSVDECYIRIYLVTEQDGSTERFPLGVFLVQTPSTGFNGRVQSVNMDCYSPLLELKEKYMPIGYSLLSGDNVMGSVCALIAENARAPLIETSDTATLTAAFVANVDDTVLTFVTDLLSSAGYTLALDELGRIYFEPVKDTASLQPVYTFDDGNSSILSADITVDRDLYGIPNTIEVVSSTSSGYESATVVNDDSSSPVSTVTRGRAVTERITDPDTALSMEDYATQYLREASALEYTVTFSHGYVPNVGVGDCVRLNYSRAGMNGIKAKITNQTINCTTGCTVNETAVYTVNLWEG